MADVPAKPPTIVELEWTRDLVFDGTSGESRMTLDSAGVAGPSPVQALAYALAACMAMDVVHIVRKGRHDLRGCRVHLSGQRAPSEPRRFLAISLHFTVTGDVPGDVVARAIQLSHERYCSVWHSLRTDIALSLTSSVSPAPTGA